MTTAAQMGMIDLSALEWPITWRWHVSTPWGGSQSQLTVDAPALKDQVGASIKLGSLLWARSVARATSVSCVLTGVDAICWRWAPAGLPGVEPPVLGELYQPAGARDASGCFVQHTGHVDRYARRHLPVPGIPATWVSEGLLTAAGKLGLHQLAHLLAMGMLGQHTGGPMVWLIAYPEALPATIANPNGVAFRRMEYLRTCWHSYRAPEPSTEPWP